MNPSTTRLTTEMLDGFVDALSRDERGRKIALRRDGQGRELFELAGGEITWMAAEPLVIEQNDVRNGFHQVLPGETARDPERLDNGRLIPKFALTRKFSPRFLKKKSTGERFKNRNHIPSVSL